MVRKPKGTRSKTPIGKLSVSQRLWDAMHVYPRFSMPELAVIAAANRNTLKRFVRYLERAGYLRVVVPINRGARRATVYELVKRTGPLAPRISHDGSVTDLNLITEKES